MKRTFMMPRSRRRPEMKLLDAAREVELARQSIDHYWLSQPDKMDTLQLDILAEKKLQLERIENELRLMSKVFWGREPYFKEVV